MGGLFAPGTTMILSPNGDILLTVIGYIYPKAMIDTLSHSKILDSMLKKKKSHGKPQVKPAPMPEQKERESDSFFQGRPGLDI